MVNELNRPQNGDNAALSERLAASNRQLQEMQEEHRQLLEEMETLRLRAAELTLLNAQRRQVRQSTEEEEVQSHVESSSETVTVASSASASGDSTNREEVPTGEEEGEEDKEEQASYLQAKLNEIANLKAQFKRVQNMVDTTKMIEEHMSSRQTVQVQSSTSVQTSRQTTSSEVRVDSEAIERAQEENPSTSSGAPDNAELLNSMLNMFTDFTSDLRGQAEGLRAERDRIRALKEDIIQRKQGK
ncbi:protein gar2 [Drosophila sechellia]|uniref:GM25420 n=1 Tax=Drosophila sechellia TaxID=7238 RepID=B4HGT3_DROSE|nr:protein gar2 [Drosophila sechellia]EDW41391.1 GM25420 [Drosophila sechellia]